jgi:hypothetical protein
MLRINVLDIAEAVGSIDERFIEEHLARREELAAKAGKRAARAEDPAGKAPAARRFGLKRILAAAVAAAAVIAVSAFAVAQFAKTPPIPAPSEESNAAVSAFTIPDNAVLPPTRYGETTGHASLEKDYNLKELYEYSDLVALIRVEDWVCEYVDSENDIGSTRFDTELLKVYKGEKTAGEHILLKQEGNSKYTFKGYPLFTYGNEMLLFAKQSFKEDGVYWIPGSYTTIVDAVNAEGTLYFIDRACCMSHIARFKAATGETDFRTPTGALAEKIVEALLKTDPVLAESYREKFAADPHTAHPFALTEDEMTRFFEMFKN